MLELLILIVLIEEKSNIYEIKQRIDSIFSFFVKTSFGSIHPALKRLEKNGHVTVKKHLTEGGQRESVYSITNKGRDYFRSLMLESLPDNSGILHQIINIKLMGLSNLEPEDQKAVVNLIKENLEYYRINCENLLNNLEDSKNSIQKKLLKHSLIKISEDIKWISSLLS